MTDPKSTADIPCGYWAAFCYQIHVLPLQSPQRTDKKLTGLCGILIPPGATFDPDDRPVCSWCAYQVRAGRVRIVP